MSSLREPLRALFLSVSVFAATAASAEPGASPRLVGEAVPVELRASGHQPDWSFSVDPQGRVTFAENAASAVTLVSSPVVAEPGKPGGMIYGARSDEHEIVAEIATGSCTDAHSGNRHTHRVTIRMSGREYHGCGSAERVQAR